MLRLLTWWLCVGLAVTGCEQARTEVLLAVDGDLAIPRQVDHVVVQVTHPDGEIKLAEADLTAEAFPRTLGLVHRGGPVGIFSVEVRGESRASGTTRTIIERRARFSFVPGETLVLPLPLLEACLNVPCGVDETCGPTGCRTIDIARSEFLEYPAGLEGLRDGGTMQPVDGGQRGDGGQSVDGSVGIDGGSDGGRPDPTRDSGTPTRDGGDVDPTDAGMPPVDAGRCPDGCDCNVACGPAEACRCVDCPCDLRCPADGACLPRCGGDARCRVTGAPGRSIGLQCLGNASCAVACNGADRCHVDCRGNSDCRVNCGMGTRCDVDCRGRAQCVVQCGDGDGDICNIDCPSGLETCPDGTTRCGGSC